MIELKNIYKNWGNSKILIDASFKCQKGEILGLVGQSGSGKTTLLSIFGLLDQPDNGEIFFRNQSVRPEMTTFLRKEYIGFVLQNNNLFSNMSAFANVKIATEISNSEIIESLVKFKINPDQDVATLSGGERQRVAIIRACLGKKELIIADEPTGSLDPDISQTMFQFLVSHLKNFASTAIIVTHNPNFYKFFDRIITINDHKIMEY